MLLGARYSIPNGLSHGDCERMLCGFYRIIWTNDLANVELGVLMLESAARELGLANITTPGHVRLISEKWLLNRPKRIPKSRSPARGNSSSQPCCA
jgi:hypothetical protein